jgi:phytoene/squalene synthetase
MKAMKRPKPKRLPPAEDLLRREEEKAAARVLRAVHLEVRATIRRIDAGLAELRQRERALPRLRAQVREQTRAWFEAHPHEGRGVSEVAGERMYPIPGRKLP